MRPLPILTDLPPAQDVYTPATDGFDQLLSGDLSNFDTLQQLLDSTTDQVAGASQDLGTTLDTIGSIFDGIDGTFSALDSSLSQVNYEQEITDTLALDKSFASGLSSWAPDLAGAVTGFLNDLGAFWTDFIQPALQIIFNAILQAIATLIAAINFLMGAIAGLLGAGGSIGGNEPSFG